MNQQPIKITVLRPPKLPAPGLHCAAVDSAGDVSLSWSPVTDSLGRSFRFYKIWVSHSLTGGFVVADSVFNINTSSWVHQGAGAHSDTLFYFVETVSGCNNMFSAFSDTVSTLFLNLVNQGNGSALLSWNDIRDSASSALPYRIFRKVAGGAFVLIDSSLSNSFVDTVSVCSLAVSYFVTLADSAGCHHRSNIRSSVFEDKISPLGVVIDSVSVNAAGHPVVGWLSSPSPDVNRFVVLRNGQAVDTVAASPFTDLAVNGGLLSYCYSIVPMDSCGNAGDSSAVHCSIRLSALVDKCNRVVRLSWNDNQDSTGQGFEVWATFNGGGAGLLASLSQGISSFVHSQVVPGGIYCYFIRKKLSGGRTTSSNRLCVKADFTPAKGFAYLRVATVANSGDVLLRVFSDTAVPLRYFTVLRKSGSHAFDSIAAVTWAPSVSNFVFDDMTAETGKRSYSYRVVAVDSCFNRDTSNIARTVFLNCVELNVYSNRLTWNDYGDWAAGTDHILFTALWRATR
jgi:hypothetical protein